MYSVVPGSTACSSMLKGEESCTSTLESRPSRRGWHVVLIEANNGGAESSPSLSDRDRDTKLRVAATDQGRQADTVPVPVVTR